MKYFFTSDTHFNHTKIIGYCNRPFKNVKEMDKKLVRNWNDRVKKEDTVFFLGDFNFKTGQGEGKDAKYWIDKLNGNIIFIRGNHDSKNNGLNAVIEYLVIHYGGQNIFMCHDPQDYNPEYKLNLCGHVHEKWLIRKTKDHVITYNVGVDMNGFRPVSINEIITNILKWKKSN